ncbi:RecD-like DNA helicase YrrC [Streptomyces sp. PAMC 26508]|nr:RecD-like DNA helicase YrrC [Streptomyces sp. PAMC 26508]
MTAHSRGEATDPPAEDHEAGEDAGGRAADTPGTPHEGGAGSAEGTDDDAPDAEAGTEEAGGQEQGTETPAAPALSEAEAELAAQRELRERIERRKAEKEGPIEAGAKLSGPAADLLAAVRAVESGEKPGTAFFDSPASAPAPRRAAPRPRPRPRPGSPSGPPHGPSRPRPPPRPRRCSPRAGLPRRWPALP